MVPTKWPHPHGPPLTCPAGGEPALIETPGGLAVAGVSSWQDHAGPLSTYGCVEYCARVSTQAQWIRATIAS
jgi:hypothetical protein